MHAFSRYYSHYAHSHTNISRSFLFFTDFLLFPLCSSSCLYVVIISFQRKENQIFWEIIKENYIFFAHFVFPKYFRFTFSIICGWFLLLIFLISFEYILNKLSLPPFIPESPVAGSLELWTLSLGEELPRWVGALSRLLRIQFPECAPSLLHCHVFPFGLSQDGPSGRRTTNLTPLGSLLRSPLLEVTTPLYVVKLKGIVALFLTKTRWIFSPATFSMRTTKYLRLKVGFPRQKSPPANSLKRRLKFLFSFLNVFSPLRFSAFFLYSRKFLCFSAFVKFPAF